jgi:hypothetical protein
LHTFALRLNVYSSATLISLDGQKKAKRVIFIHSAERKGGIVSLSSLKKNNYSLYLIVRSQKLHLQVEFKLFFAISQILLFTLKLVILRVVLYKK